MTRKKDSAKAAERKAKQLAAIAEQQEDLPRVWIRRVLEEVMGAEMDEVTGAEKGSGWRAGRDTVRDTIGGRW